MRKGKFKILPGFYIALAIFVLFIPIPWILAWLTAALIHEIFHIIALRLCGYEITSFQIGAMRARLESNVAPGIKMIICALAGPLSGFVLLIFLRITPRVALCGLMQSVGNLLPICPMDGGRALHSLLSVLLPQQKANHICNIVEFVVWILLLTIAVYASVRFRLGLFPFVTAVVVWIKKKYLANQCLNEYNMVNRE